MKRIIILFLILGCIAQEPFRFEYYEPKDTTLTIGPNEPVEFSCIAYHVKTPQLLYTWYVNDEKVSETPEYTFTKDEGEYTVTIEVSDGETAISRQWLVTVADAPDFEKIQKTLEHLRDLEFVEPVNRVVLDRNQMREELLIDLEESREDILAEQKLYTALHVWDSNKDLFRDYIDMYTTQVASYYDTKDHTFYEVVDPDEPLAYREFVAAHELVHALQDQHSYLDFDTENDDKYLAFLCLVEGDAMYHQFAYLYKMTQSERKILLEYVNALDIPVINRFLENLLMLRYDLGYAFVTTMSANIDQLYERLPASSEQIMHPEKYEQNEAPLTVEIPSVPGWELVTENVFGEAFIMTFLKEHIAADTAAQAAAGWGGDAYAYYEKGNNYLLVVNTYWDTDADAAEFLKAYHDFTVSWSGNTIQKTGELYETPTGFLALIQNRTQVIIVESPSREAVETVLSLMGFSSHIV